jgi:MFS family permease
MILDKIGPKYLIACSAALCSMGSFLFCGFSDIHIAQLGRLLIGAGSACAFVSCLQIATSLLPVKYFPMIAGITNMMGTVG